MSKKGAKVEEKVYFGRPKNNVTIGLVGLPNVGKSSTFNLLGKLQVPAENYPFCTIDPAVTSVVVPDERFDHLVNLWKPAKEIQAVLAVTDIAGLVKGAAEGKGLGNEFLSNISAVDAIYHVVRKFPGKKVEHVEGDIDPCRDLAIIRAELQKKDLVRVKMALEAEKKKVRSRKPTKVEEMQFGALQKAIDYLDAGKDVRFGEWQAKEIYFLNQFNLLTAKPVVYLVNMGSKAYKEGKKAGKKITAWVAENCPGEPIIAYSAKYESALLKVDDDKKKKLAKKGIGSMIPEIIWAGYRALNLIHFFTTGKDEVRAWSIRKGLKAPQAAGVIHGDFEKFFRAADTYSFDALKEHGDEKAVKEAGKLRTQGKEYVVSDGDIMFFHHTAGGAKKK
mmetsp:Transcript_6405/g.8807  ORF Transcript_6405/g.8807 Transcript_6405/m.8807 type:complete len:391 (-) Transcript_6405:351-1523(-)|eukprot:CAMPEP_0184489528 /NCGR_PEP_ID=MMETSP0113_2-20130426/15738_1 /TAXON_ID=91329 /ORGANISM="Norrisiella sphaerica, Strain BC52" /LENGTH=390 /DNA_ID=CAMNT_0026873013 /DNA_START=78 /DNA_END=1250 /DNA_ORIENTATION=+